MDDLLTRLQEELKILNTRLEAAHKELGAAQKASTATHRDLDTEASRLASREATMQAGPNFYPGSNVIDPLLKPEYEARKAEIRQDLADGYGDTKRLGEKAAAADKALAEQQELVKGLGETKQRLQGEIAREHSRESTERTEHLQLAMQSYGERKGAANLGSKASDRLKDFPPMPGRPKEPTPEERQAELNRQQQPPDLSK